MWGFDKELAGGPTECFRAEIEGEVIMYLSNPTVESGGSNYYKGLSVYYVCKTLNIAIFHDGKLFLPRHEGQTVTWGNEHRIWLRERRKEDVALKIAEIGERVKKFLPYFRKIPAKNDTFPDEINILSQIIENLETYKGGKLTGNEEEIIAWYS